MEKLKAALSRLNPKNFKKKTKVILLVILAILIVFSILGMAKPAESKLLDSPSEAMKLEIEKDADRTLKEVTIVYNNLWIVSLGRFEKTGMPSESFIGFCGAIIPANDGFLEVLADIINYTYRILGVGQSLLYGAKLTIFLTIISIAAGLILGTLLAIGKISKHKWISMPCSVYIFFFRGTPLMMQLLCIYLAVPAVFGFSWRGFFTSYGAESVFMGAFLASFISFMLNSAAYCAEIVRAAIQSIDKGQNEAGKALGMSYRQIMTQIILPQSIRRLIPPIANEFIMILKDASLVSVIGLQDITTISKTISSNGSYLVFLPAMVIYLVITWFFSYIFNKLESKYSIYE